MSDRHRGLRSLVLPVALALVALPAAVGIAACTETTRSSYEGDDSGPPVTPSLPSLDAAGFDAAPSPVDATAPDLGDPQVVCGDAGPCAVELVRGREHFCVRLSDGTVRCWGGDQLENDYPVGTLGSLPPADAGADAAPFGSVPIPVPGLTGIVELSANGNVTCARDGDGGLRCWGNNVDAQLGLTRPLATWDSDVHAAPVKPSLPGPVAHVDVSEDAVCARLVTGAEWCWGASLGQQLLRPDPTDSSLVLAPGLAPFAAALGTLDTMLTGPYAGLGRTTDGTLYSWGSADNFGSPGDHIVPYGGIFGRISSLAVDPDPYPIAIDGKVLSVVSAADQACAVVMVHGRDPGAPPTSLLECWGHNDAGQLGNGGYGTFLQYDDLPTPAPLPPDVFAQQASTAAFATCTRTTKGTVYCAGTNAGGRLGRPLGFAGSPQLVEVAGLDGVATVAVGGSSSCALLTSGEVMCWGGNELGQLGRGSQDDLPHPAPSKVVLR